jgi:hypothetical protein
VRHPFRTSRITVVIEQEANLADQPLSHLILKGLALAMGVAVVVLGILGTSTPGSLNTLTGIGLASLAAWALQTGK